MLRVVSRLLAVSSAVAILSLFSVNTVHAVSDDSEPETSYAEQPAILISEIQTRTVDSANDEFVELYNTSEEVIDLAEFELQYRRTSEKEWRSKVYSSQSEDANFLVEPGNFYILGTEQFQDNNPDIETDLRLSSGSAERDGHIRIIALGDDEDSEDLVHDLVGWGEADDPLGEAAPAPERGESIIRCFDENGFMVNTDNNSDDFTVNVTQLPGQGIDCPEPENNDDVPPPNEDDEEQTGDDSEQHNEACEDILITEVLPNPEGLRSEHPREEHAFIELYNAHDTDYIPLEGCGLEAEYVSSENAAGTFWFADIELEPGEYRAFYEEETNIALPVSPSGRVYLLSADSDDEGKLDYVVYPDDVSKGAAWARFGADEWRETYELSPGDDNVLQSLRPCPEGEERNPETNRCGSIDTDDSQELEPCGEGRERNPETNRCRKIGSDSSSLKPCGPGRERNPETNRCRNIESSSSTLVPCGPGRRRNPETNRCRNISSSGSDLKPCGQGRERNPETNRCRNVTKDNEGAIAGVKDIETVAVSSRPSWWLVAVMVLLAIGYAGWEWRYDIFNVLAKIRDKPPPVFSKRR